MMQILKVSLVGFGLVLAGCSAGEEAPQASPPPVMQMPGGVDDVDEYAGVEEEPAFEEAVSLEVVTDFLTADEGFLPAAGNLPVGLVLFNKEEELKNAVLCDAYTKELRTYAEAKAQSPYQDFFVTYWLLKEQPADYSSCDALRQSYDYERAAVIKAEYGLTEATGPVFLAVDSDGNSVFLDLSGASLEATRSAVDQWLVLALEASADEELIEEKVEEALVETDGTDSVVPEAAALAVSSRFSLASFSSGMKSRFLTETAPTVNESKQGETTLFAYTDSGTGYRIGSTLRF